MTSRNARLPPSKHSPSKYATFVYDRLQTWAFRRKFPHIFSHLAEYTLSRFVQHITGAHNTTIHAFTWQRLRIVAVKGGGRYLAKATEKNRKENSGSSYTLHRSTLQKIHTQLQHYNVFSKFPLRFLTPPPSHPATSLFTSAKYSYSTIYRCLIKKRRQM